MCDNAERSPGKCPINFNKSSVSFYWNLLGIFQTTFRHCRVLFSSFLDHLCQNSCIFQWFSFSAFFLLTGLCPGDKTDVQISPLLLHPSLGHDVADVKSLFSLHKRCKLSPIYYAMLHSQPYICFARTPPIKPFRCFEGWNQILKEQLHSQQKSNPRPIFFFGVSFGIEGNFNITCTLRKAIW